MKISVSDKIGNIVGKGDKADYQWLLRCPQYFQRPCSSNLCPPGWFSGEHVGLMTWWL